MSDTLSKSWHREESQWVFRELSRGKPFQELMEDTVDLAECQPNESWLEICWGTEPSASRWFAFGGNQGGKMVALDCSNGPTTGDISSRPSGLSQGPLHGDLSQGLPQFASHSFDGVVANLSLSFAESRDPVSGEFNDQAFRHIFEEIWRVLKPGGRLVFSIHTPDADFGSILWHSLGLPQELTHPLKLLRQVRDTMRVSKWIKEETNKGRFHYLSIDALKTLLHDCGFPSVEWKRTLANQAFVIRADKTEFESINQAA